MALILRKWICPEIFGGNPWDAQRNSFYYDVDIEIDTQIGGCMPFLGKVKVLQWRDFHGLPTT